MKNDRLFAITNILIRKGCVTAKELADEFNVSIRTIYRDIDVLSANGIPVYTTQGKGGGISIIDGYTIDRTLLSDKEQEEILTALESVKATGRINVDNALQKLSGLFKRSSSEWVEIGFSSWGENEREKEIFKTIKESILASNMLKITYFSNKGEKTDREVEPVKLIFKGFSWYLYGFCKRREDYRFFKLSRIGEIKVSDSSAEKRESDIGNITDKQYVDNKGKKLLLKLKADKKAITRIYDEFEIVDMEYKNDQLIAHAYIYDRGWLLQYLMGFGDDIEILEPSELREEYKNMLENIIKKYIN